MENEGITERGNKGVSNFSNGEIRNAGIRENVEIRMKGDWRMREH